MAINNHNQPSDITSDVKEILALVRDIQQQLANRRNPSGTIEVTGVITGITPAGTRTALENVSLREVGGTTRWLRMSIATAAMLQEGQSIWAKGVYRVERRNEQEYHLIYVESSDYIKILEKS